MAAHRRIDSEEVYDARMRGEPIPINTSEARKQGWRETGGVLNE
jgi:hypothetical protein